MTLLVAVLIGTIGIVGLWFMLNRHADQTQTELQKLQQQQASSDGKDITSTTNRLNATINTLTTTLGTPRAWSTDTITVMTGLPSTISISSLTIFPDGKFQLIGTAESRQTFVQLETTLKSNPKLTAVATVSTASRRTSVPFDFTGSILAPTKT